MSVSLASSHLDQHRQCEKRPGFSIDVEQCVLVDMTVKSERITATLPTPTPVEFNLICVRSLPIAFVEYRFYIDHIYGAKNVATAPWARTSYPAFWDIGSQFASEAMLPMIGDVWRTAACPSGSFVDFKSTSGEPLRVKVCGIGMVPFILCGAQYQVRAMLVVGIPESMILDLGFFNNQIGGPICARELPGPPASIVLHTGEGRPYLKLDRVRRNGVERLELELLVESFAVRRQGGQAGYQFAIYVHYAPESKYNILRPYSASISRLAVEIDSVVAALLSIRTLRVKHGYQIGLVRIKTASQAVYDQVTAPDSIMPRPVLAATEVQRGELLRWRRVEYLVRESRQRGCELLWEMTGQHTGLGAIRWQTQLMARSQRPLVIKPINVEDGTEKFGYWRRQCGRVGVRGSQMFVSMNGGACMGPFAGGVKLSLCCKHNDDQQERAELPVVREADEEDEVRGGEEEDVEMGEGGFVEEEDEMEEIETEVSESEEGETSGDDDMDGDDEAGEGSRDGAREDQTSRVDQQATAGSVPGQAGFTTAHRATTGTQPQPQNFYQPLPSSSTFDAIMSRRRF